MPEGAVYVGRPTRWGNPFRIVPYAEARAAGIGDVSVVMGTFWNGRVNEDRYRSAAWRFRAWLTTGLQTDYHGCEPHGPLSPEWSGKFGNCATGYEYALPTRTLHRAPYTVEDIQHELGHATALACWCPLDQPCHADVLIELLDA
jgi:hypothetical protein